MEEYQADRFRDAFMRSLGIEVMRFTGAEIWENPIECAQKVAYRMLELTWPDSNGWR